MGTDSGYGVKKPKGPATRVEAPAAKNKAIREKLIGQKRNKAGNIVLYGRGGAKVKSRAGDVVGKNKKGEKVITRAGGNKVVIKDNGRTVRVKKNGTRIVTLAKNEKAPSGLLRVRRYGGGK